MLQKINKFQRDILLDELHLKINKKKRKKYCCQFLRNMIDCGVYERYIDMW